MHVALGLSRPIAVQPETIEADVCAEGEGRLQCIATGALSKAVEARVARVDDAPRKECEWEALARLVEDLRRAVGRLDGLVGSGVAAFTPVSNIQQCAASVSVRRSTGECMHASRCSMRELSL